MVKKVQILTRCRGVSLGSEMLQPFKQVDTSDITEFRMVYWTNDNAWSGKSFASTKNKEYDHLAHARNEMLAFS